MSQPDENDLYELLGVSRSATKVDIKKAFHKAALSHHPDKVPESKRSEAEVRFKSVSRAYEILYDDDMRHLYDTHGMRAFEKGTSHSPAGMEPDFDDILEQMFGMGMGMGGHPFGAMPRGHSQRARNKERKGLDEHKEYVVTLEDLYRGKTVKFASTKSVVCETCEGRGGAKNAKTSNCGPCRGSGQVAGLRQFGGVLAESREVCSGCSGSGRVYSGKYKCKRCKGNKVVPSKKYLEVYIPPGSRHKDKIRLTGEADQAPDQEPGDLVFHIREQSHSVFCRSGDNLSADIHVSLAEALTGLNRVVLQHLDGRGISIDTTQPAARTLRPDQILKISGEGMPRKRAERRGDLFLVVKVDFPTDDWLRDHPKPDQLRALLPAPPIPIEADVIDDVHFEVQNSLDEFDDSSENGNEWEDEDGDEEHAEPECRTQ